MATIFTRKLGELISRRFKTDYQLLPTDRLSGSPAQPVFEFDREIFAPSQSLEFENSLNTGLVVVDEQIAQALWSPVDYSEIYLGKLHVVYARPPGSAAADFEIVQRYNFNVNSGLEFERVIYTDNFTEGPITAVIDLDQHFVIARDPSPARLVTMTIESTLLGDPAGTIVMVLEGSGQLNGLARERYQASTP